MTNRQHKCPQCPKVFRTESGRKWHIAHRHEIERAIDTLDEEYKAKFAGLKDENGFLQQKAADFERRLNETKMELVNQMMKRIEANNSALESKAEAQNTGNELWKAALLIITQGDLIEKKLGLPFAKQVEAFEKLKSP